MQRSAEELAGGEIQPLPAGISSAADERRRADEQGFLLFLGNLGLEVDEAFLSRVFCKFDSFIPGSERVKRDKDRRTQCYGFVTFAKREDIIAALEEYTDPTKRKRKIKDLVEELCCTSKTVLLSVYKPMAEPCSLRPLPFCSTTPIYMTRNRSHPLMGRVTSSWLADALLWWC